MFEKSIMKVDIFNSIDKEKYLDKELDLIYVIKGEVFIKLEFNEYTMKKNDLLLINNRNKYSFKAIDDAIFICISISHTELCKIIEHNSVKFNCNSIIDHEKDYTELKKIINNILDCLLKNEKKLALMSLQFQLIDELVGKFIFNDDIVLISSNKEKHYNRLDQIISYINENYNQQITLNDLANKEFLSVPYLSKFIKEQLGVTFTEYLNNVRLNHAIEDLINKDSPLTKVALENGFATTFSFNKYFKDKYNIMPSEYRKKFRQVNNLNNKSIVNVKEEVGAYLYDSKLEKNPTIKFTNDIEVKIDINNSKIIKKHYNKIINIGYANDILQSLLQEHIIMLKNEMKFEYARFLGIFNEDMNIENGYTFYKVDKILDFIISNQMKPFIDLMPKKKRLYKNTQEDINVEITNIELRSLEEWQKLIHKFIVHCINRYGKEEVEKWYFDVSTMEKTVNDKNEVSAYFQIFEVIYTTIKQMLPNVKVGGPGGHFSKMNSLEFFKDWKSFRSKPDFISIFIYPYVEILKDYVKGAQLSSDRNYFLNKLEGIKKNIKDLGYCPDEIIISEWNSTVSDRNYINDSCSKATYIIKNVIDSMGKVDKLCYMMASDAQTEYLDTDLFLYGGKGLVSKNGIKKPSFYAFSFLEKLSENIVKKGENYIVTKNSSSSFTMICYNYKQFNEAYLLSSEESIGLEEMKNIYENKNDISISFSIENVPKGRYRVKSFILSESCGSVLDEWIKLNADNNLSSDEITYLKGISVPRLRNEYIETCEEILKYRVKLLPHEVRLVTFDMDYESIM